jgi:hypothetical protein
MPGGPAEFMFQLRPPPFKYGISFHQNGALVTISHQPLTIAEKVAGPQEATPRRLL